MSKHESDKREEKQVTIAKEKDYGPDGPPVGAPIVPVELSQQDADALATLIALRADKPDTELWKLVFEAEQVVGHGRKRWDSLCPPGVDGYYKSGVVKGAMTRLYRKYVTERVMVPYDHGPDPKVIDIDHPILTTVEAEYDRAMIYESKRTREQECAFEVLLVMLAEGTAGKSHGVGTDQRPDDWTFVPWWRDE